MSSIDGYVQLQRRIKIDTDFLELSQDAQWLYYTLLADVNHAGIADWKPKRLATRSKTASVRSVNIAGQELVDSLYAVIDLDTEEVLIRTYVKHDGAHKQPNTCKSITNAFGSASSQWIRLVLAYQVQEIWEGIERTRKAGAIPAAEWEKITKRWVALDLLMEYPARSAVEVLELHHPNLLED